MREPAMAAPAMVAMHPQDLVDLPHLGERKTEFEQEDGRQGLGVGVSELVEDDGDEKRNGPSPGKELLERPPDRLIHAPRGLDFRVRLGRK